MSYPTPEDSMFDYRPPASELAAQIKGGELPELWVSFVRTVHGDQRDSYSTFRDIKFHATEIEALREVNKGHYSGSKRAVKVLPGQSLDDAWSTSIRGFAPAIPSIPSYGKG